MKGITLISYSFANIKNSCSCNLKVEMGDACSILLFLDLEDGDDLCILLREIEERFFADSLEIKRLMQLPMPIPIDPPNDRKEIKLPKLDIPTFNGDILFWKAFWEQFNIVALSGSDISDAKKLV